jgi:hypothetical protein
MKRRHHGGGGNDEEVVDDCASIVKKQTNDGDANQNDETKEIPPTIDGDGEEGDDDEEEDNGEGDTPKIAAINNPRITVRSVRRRYHFDYPPIIYDALHVGQHRKDVIELIDWLTQQSSLTNVIERLKRSISFTFFNDLLPDDIIKFCMRWCHYTDYPSLSRINKRFRRIVPPTMSVSSQHNHDLFTRYLTSARSKAKVIPLLHHISILHVTPEALMAAQANTTFTPTDVARTTSTSATTTTLPASLPLMVYFPKVEILSIGLNELGDALRSFLPHIPRCHTISLYTNYEASRAMDDLQLLDEKHDPSPAPRYGPKDPRQNGLYSQLYLPMPLNLETFLLSFIGKRNDNGDGVKRVIRWCEHLPSACRCGNMCYPNWKVHHKSAVSRITLHGHRDGSVTVYDPDAIQASSIMSAIKSRVKSNGLCFKCDLIVKANTPVEPSPYPTPPRQPCTGTRRIHLTASRKRCAGRCWYSNGCGGSCRYEVCPSCQDHVCWNCDNIIDVGTTGNWTRASHTCSLCRKLLCERCRVVQGRQPWCSSCQPNPDFESEDD